MSAGSVETKRVPPLSSNVVIVKLSDIVKGNVNRNTGDSIRHFARPYLLWKSESAEKTERRQREDRCLCKPFVTTGACPGSSSCGA